MDDCPISSNTMNDCPIPSNAMDDCPIPSYDMDDGPTCFVTVPGLVPVGAEARVPPNMRLPSIVYGTFRPPLDVVRSTDTRISNQRTPFPTPTPLQYRPNLSLDPADMDPMDVGLNRIRNVVPITTTDLRTRTPDEGFRDDLSMRTNFNLGCMYCTKGALALRERKLMLPVHFMFLFAMLFTAAAGGVSIHKCRMSPYVPPILLEMGICGSLLVWFQMAMLMRGFHSEERLADLILSCGIIWGYTSVFIFHIIEMMLFIGKTPSFDPKDVNYCEKGFYKYTYWTNWFGLSFLLLMAVLCVPKTFRDTCFRFAGLQDIF